MGWILAKNMKHTKEYSDKKLYSIDEQITSRRTRMHDSLRLRETVLHFMHISDTNLL